ncbi:MAG: RagB/SusD family nutrient uptake outer membrane protein [Prevotella sp.]|nr:RagB/SusD family nutrient uptake outer membrane protein [Prevotella sp.]
MKNKLFIFAAVLLTLGFTACSLDVDDVTEMSTDNFPTTTDDADATLAAIYYGLNAVNAYPQESYLYMALLASDDEYGGGGTNDKAMQAFDFITYESEDQTNDFYEAHYSSINRANTLIAALESIDMDEEDRAQYMGEALFMRAFYHYELASMYGNIPLMTEPKGDAPDMSEQTAADLWGQILQDLYTAATTMPAVNQHNSGHADKYCAEAMLGRAWLFYTGMYCNGDDIAALTSTTYNPLTSVEMPNGETLTKQMVIDCLKDCYNNSGYSLVKDYRTLWPYTNSLTVEDYSYTKGQGLVWCQDYENGSSNADDTEIMFATKFNKMASWNTTIGYGNGYALHFAVRGTQPLANTFPFGQGWGTGPITPNLVKDWKAAEPNDPRYEATIQDVNVLPDYEVDGVHADPAYAYGGATDFVQETGYMGKKLPAVTCMSNIDDENAGIGSDGTFCTAMWGTDGILNDSFQTNNWQDLIHIRYADVLLMLSELTEDATYMNEVRARVGLPAVSYSLAALQNERRWEFATEGTRWNDIRRWHIAAAALDKQLDQDIWVAAVPTTNTTHNGGYSSRYNATAGFQSIPYTQISLGYIQQNDGWTGAEAMYGGW